VRPRAVFGTTFSAAVSKKANPPELHFSNDPKVGSMVSVNIQSRSLLEPHGWGKFRKLFPIVALICIGIYRLSDAGNILDSNTPILAIGLADAIERQSAHCPITSIVDLSEEEGAPMAGFRHMVDPPVGGKIALICCETTKGSFSALLHRAWAPIGVDHLLNMIKEGYFSTRIPLFRCTDACQFGLSADPEQTKQYDAQLQDDPMWLPPGKDHQANERGVKRYPEGMWTYAGSGPNSRSNQFVITLRPNAFMGGGSPWEVPLGEFVGKESFDLLHRLYTGYGERGPTQAILKKEGASERVEKDWPLMDYILNCTILDEVEL
jgi:cyclophilin family peptidyl-prolyl cis-trans isomerase